MLVTPSGIVTDVSPEQPSNAEYPMLVTLSGIVTDVSPEQPENAELPMLVTLSGIVTVPFTPNTTVFPSFDSIRPLQEEYVGLFAPMENDVSPEQL